MISSVKKKNIYIYIYNCLLDTICNLPNIFGWMNLVYTYTDYLMVHFLQQSKC